MQNPYLKEEVSPPITVSPTIYKVEFDKNFEELKCDFMYNLRLLSDRDYSLARYKRIVDGLKSQLTEKNKELVIARQDFQRLLRIQEAMCTHFQGNFAGLPAMPCEQNGFKPACNNVQHMHLEVPIDVSECVEPSDDFPHKVKVLEKLLKITTEENSKCQNRILELEQIIKENKSIYETELNELKTRHKSTTSNLVDTTKHLEHVRSEICIYKNVLKDIFIHTVKVVDDVLVKNVNPQDIHSACDNAPWNPFDVVKILIQRMANELKEQRQIIQSLQECCGNDNCRIKGLQQAAQIKQYKEQNSVLIETIKSLKNMSMKEPPAAAGAGAGARVADCPQTPAFQVFRNTPQENAGNSKYYNTVSTKMCLSKKCRKQIDTNHLKHVETKLKFIINEVKKQGKNLENEKQIKRLEDCVDILKKRLLRHLQEKLSVIIVNDDGDTAAQSDDVRLHLLEEKMKEISVSVPAEPSVEKDFLLKALEEIEEELLAIMDSIDCATQYETLAPTKYESTVVDENGIEDERAEIQKLVENTGLKRAGINPGYKSSVAGNSRSKSMVTQHRASHLFQPDNCRSIRVSLDRALSVKQLHTTTEGFHDITDVKSTSTTGLNNTMNFEKRNINGPSSPTDSPQSMKNVWELLQET